MKPNEYQISSEKFVFVKNDGKLLVTDLPDGIQRAVHIFFRGGKAQREPDGSSGKGVQGFVGRGGAVEAAAG